MRSFSIQKLQHGLVDYNFLMDQLKAFHFPRNKINQLLKRKELTRIKKGLYQVEGREFSKFQVANLIYGPSYVSMESALSHYQLIPEATLATISVTPKRSKNFLTPVGDYIYEYLPMEKYRVGYTCEEVTLHISYLIATPEKALADKIYRYSDLKTPSILEAYLREDLRLDWEGLSSLSPARIREINTRFQIPVLEALVKILKDLK